MMGALNVSFFGFIWSITFERLNRFQNPLQSIEAIDHGYKTAQ